MVKLAGFNSRAQDYVDLWMLMRYENFDVLCSKRRSAQPSRADKRPCR